MVDKKLTTACPCKGHKENCPICTGSGEVFVGQPSPFAFSSESDLQEEAREEFGEGLDPDFPQQENHITGKV